MPHKTTVHGQLSRVVLVSGPRDLLHLPSLFNYFQERFYFPINRIVAFTGDDGYDTYEMRFASFYCQSEMAVMTIEREKTFKEMGMRIEYARDPCDVAVMQHQILAPVGSEARGDEVKAEGPTADQAWTDRWDKATLAWNAQEDWEAAS